MSADPATLPVADAADRGRFMDELDRNFCVSASAGAGKTTAIVRRIASMVRRSEDGEDDPVGRLAVVTYTRAAAAELRVRAREELQRDGTATSELTARRLRRLNGAFFGTLHGFTLELLRRHGGVLGLPADAELLEEVEEPLLWDQFISDEGTLARCLDNDWFRAASRHTTFAQVANLAANVSAAEAEELLEVEVSPGVVSPNFAEVLGFVPRGKGASNDEKNQVLMRRFAEGLRAGEGYVPIPKITNGSAAFKDLVEKVLAPIRRVHRHCLARAAALLALGFLEYRLARGRMTYEDMIYLGRKLASDAGMVDEMRTRRWIILLDEAQDTEPDMFDLLLELVRPPGAVVGEWPRNPAAAPPEPGRFCFVGDDQQTIYGDARNLQHYQRLVRAFAGGHGGEALNFSVTMRLSRAGIDAVNRVFEGRPIHPGPAGREEPGGEGKFRRLDPKPNAHPGQVTRLALARPNAEIEQKPEERITDEARQVGRWLRQQGLAGLGISRWDALAVLAPRNKWLDQIGNAMSAVGLPIERLSSQKPRSQLPAFSWPLATLRVLLWPDDLFETIGVLREIFAISDVAMAQAHRARPGCLLVAPHSGDTGCPEMDRALSLLRGLREEVVGSGLKPVAQALDLVRERLGLEARLGAGGFDLAPLDWLRDQAAAAEAAGTPLGAWLDEMRTGADRPLPLAPIGKSIQLLNCHKAKGLEWDVVVLIGLGRKFSSLNEKYPRVERTSDGLHVTLQKEDRIEVNDAEAAEVAENARLLYVAMTRAKRHLVLADPGEIYGRGQPFLPGSATGTFVEVLGLAGEPPPGDGQSWPEVPSVAVGEEPLTPEPIYAPTPIRRVRPSSLGHGTEAGDDREPPEFEQTVGGIDYGNWWHETMQYFPWRGSAGEQEAYGKQALERAAELGLGTRAEEELGRLLGADFWRSWSEPGRVVLTEIPFLDPASAEEWLDGVVDCVVTGPKSEEVLVLDWKTDRPSKGESAEALAERLRQTYGPQLGAYRTALLRLPGVKMCHLALYSTATGRWIEIP